MAALICSIEEEFGAIRLANIENVHAMKDQGVTSMFNMGTGFGIWAFWRLSGFPTNGWIR